MEATPAIANGSHSDNATFSCFSLGGPNNTFSWTNVRSNTVVANNSELTLVDLVASNGGQYQCLVENPAGSGSTSVTLNGNTTLVQLCMCILFIEVPTFIAVSPLVTEHPQDMNVTISEGIIILTCTATGFPSPIITWFHNDTIDTIGSYNTTIVVNYYTTTSTFMMMSPMVNDSGRYFCRASIDGYDDANSDVVTVLVQGDHY